jgi:hypothetical protein
LLFLKFHHHVFGLRFFLLSLVLYLLSTFIMELSSFNSWKCILLINIFVLISLYFWDH